MVDRHTKWERECEAWINYDPFSKNLSVSFTNVLNNTLVKQDGLSYIVDLRHELPEWVIFGFSAATGGWCEKHSVTSWRFNSSDILLDTNNSLRPTAKGDNKTRYVVGLIVVVVVVFLAILAFGLWKKKNNYEGEVEELRFAVEMSSEFEIGAAGPRRFSYLELARSTANFAESEKLGEGGFGAVYKGFLKDSRTYVAVKRVSETSTQGFKEYASEVRIISRARHRNLVQLIGWCHQKRKLLLVYEFMENGSLDLHLFKRKSLLTWSFAISAR
uniref:L-type lectin-domain containing receptor kinase IX.1-like n=1 Tax=Erigeron canadensis TaxID=72917 RepID=UPI001CB8FF86|nr:L-type lectin-domain containing receptor kinase IX.1-like [Erigeron canadensis]